MTERLKVNKIVSELGTLITIESEPSTVKALRQFDYLMAGGYIIGHIDSINRNNNQCSIRLKDIKYSAKIKENTYLLSKH